MLMKKKIYDEEREMILKDNDFKLIRFKNHEIVNDLENTLKKLKEFISGK